MRLPAFFMCTLTPGSILDPEAGYRDFLQSDLVYAIGGRDDNKIFSYNNKHSLRSNTKGYGCKTH